MSYLFMKFSFTQLIRFPVKSYHEIFHSWQWLSQTKILGVPKNLRVSKRLILGEQ